MTWEDIRNRVLAEEDVAGWSDEAVYAAISLAVLILHAENCVPDMLDAESPIYDLCSVPMIPMVPIGGIQGADTTVQDTQPQGTQYFRRKRIPWVLGDEFFDGPSDDIDDIRVNAVVSLARAILSMEAPGIMERIDGLLKNAADAD